MSNLTIQLIALVAFFILFVNFQNNMENDKPYSAIENTTLLSSTSSIGIINESTMSQEGESMLSTVKNMATFSIETDSVFISSIFWILSLWIIIVVYLLLHPFKGS